MMENEEFRCKVCGGFLVIENPQNGICKCQNCGNKTQIKLEGYKQNELPNYIQSTIPLMVNMTNEDVEKLAIIRKKHNAVFAMKGIIAIYAICIVALYAVMMSFYAKGVLSFGTLEIVITSLIGLGIPFVYTTFSKVYKGKSESLLLYIFLMFIFTAIFVAVIYFGLNRYF